MKSFKKLYDTMLRNKLCQNPLPYENIQYNMINPLSSASVLVIIHFTECIPTVLLTKRSAVLKNHAGEISFPGGRFSVQDESFLDTAIRETFEEIGLTVNKKHIVGFLNPTYTFTSRILIYPFVALKDKIPVRLRPNCEVEKIINLSVDKLKESLSVDLCNSTKNLTMFKFIVDEHVIWGATARILKDLIDKLLSP
ncbi:MAG TPA: CoA pyrophosphatase [Candidatus Nitrosocosmicus sp.]|nr:CoA pyrophosphatase [Candidatus Nitrosocosmicus sp.]